MREKPILIAVEDTVRKEISDIFRCACSVRQSLLSEGFLAKIIHIGKSDLLSPVRVKEKIKKLNPLCVFNLFEGFSGDSDTEVEFVRILEETGIAFTGNSSHSLEICLNKAGGKKILAKNNLPVPGGIFVRFQEALEEIGFAGPFFIKPCFEDASVGIEEDCLVKNKAYLELVVKCKLKRFPRGLLIEEFIPGKEYSAGFFGDYPYELVGISVLDYSKYPNLTPFLTYGSKWEKSRRAYKLLNPSCKLKLEAELRKEIVNLCVRAGEILGCRGYFRVDLREKDGRLFILDINPNPDIDRDSGFMKQAYNRGYSYNEVIKKILNLAK